MGKVWTVPHGAGGAVRVRCGCGFCSNRAAGYGEDYSTWGAKTKEVTICGPKTGGGDNFSVIGWYDTQTFRIFSPSKLRK